jgi:hypothetical protein
MKIKQMNVKFQKWQENLNHLDFRLDSDDNDFK